MTADEKKKTTRAKKKVTAIVASARRGAKTVKAKVDKGQLRQRMTTAAKRGAGAAQRGTGAVKGWVSRNEWIRHKAKQTAGFSTRLVQMGRDRIESSNLKAMARDAWGRYPALEQLRQELMHAFSMNERDAEGTPTPRKKKATTNKKTSGRRTTTSARTKATRKKTGARKKTTTKKKTTREKVV